MSGGKYYVAIEDFARGCIGPFESYSDMLNYLQVCEHTSGRVMWVMLDTEPLFEQAKTACHTQVVIQPIEGVNDGS